LNSDALHDEQPVHLIISMKLPAAVAPSQQEKGIPKETCRILQGPRYLVGEGVEFRTWAPAAKAVEAVIFGPDDQEIRTIRLGRGAEGCFTGLDTSGKPGDLYMYRLDGERRFPDPASRWQPRGVHGPSMVVDASTYEWADTTWQRPPLRNLVIYELHVGTFTAAGTFSSAIERLSHVRALGCTAVEIMPIGEFPGARGWGYDGVYLYAPSRAYGKPDDLRRFVDAAHAQGLTVILDVVYNHFGPDGNYLSCYIGDYLDEARKTPWGGAIKYGDPQFHGLRDLVVANPGYWMREFHIDGFRFDATHAIHDDSTPHILGEMTRTVHELGGFAIAEDSRRDAQLITPEEKGGLGFDAVWADDFHHSVRVGFTQERECYFASFCGGLREQIEILGHGWRITGPKAGPPTQGSTQGSHMLATESFVHCISNHDQVGNRALGERLSDCVRPDCYRAASALLCLSPYTPLLFMGQEWSASTPFLFFTDHEPDLGKLVTEGRREEFREFAAFRDEEARKRIPDPQSEKTFLRSKLLWDEPMQPAHAQILLLYQDCLALRNREAAFSPGSRKDWHIETLECGAGALCLRHAEEQWLVIFDLDGGHEGCLLAEAMLQSTGTPSWQVVLSTSENRYGGSGEIHFNPEEATVQFNNPGLVVLRAST
jgi:maltooligosyltrehalose trehalohydrolase